MFTEWHQTTSIKEQAGIRRITVAGNVLAGVQLLTGMEVTSCERRQMKEGSFERRPWHGGGEMPMHV
jgi:hypothetical protein